MLMTLLFLHATVQAALLGQCQTGTALAGDLCLVRTLHMWQHLQLQHGHGAAEICATALPSFGEACSCAGARWEPASAADLLVRCRPVWWVGLHGPPLELEDGPDLHPQQLVCSLLCNQQGGPLQLAPPCNMSPRPATTPLAPQVSPAGSTARQELSPLPGQT